MREMKRRIARHMMELAGIEKINKRRFDAPARKIATGDNGAPKLDRKASYFALHWKAYLDPESKEREALHNKLRREAALAARRDPRPGKGKRIAPWPLAPRAPMAAKGAKG